VINRLNVWRDDRQDNKLGDPIALLDDEVLAGEVLKLDFDLSPIVRIDPARAGLDVIFHRQSGPRSDASDVTIRDAEGQAGRHQRPADVDSPFTRMRARDHGPLGGKEIVSRRSVCGAMRDFGAGRKAGNFHGRVRITIPCRVASTTISARSTNRPLHTTPGIFSRSASFAASLCIHSVPLV